MNSSPSHWTPPRPSAQAEDSISRVLAAAGEHCGRPAIVEGGRTTTYGELDNRLRRLAAIFATTREPTVLVAVPQGADAYAAILAAGLAGGFHTPLNLAAPAGKLERIAGLLQPDFIVGAPAVTAGLLRAARNARVIDPAAPLAVEPLAGSGTRHRLAYVLFTSGSTGLPKGVAVPRIALDHYVGWLQSCFAMTPDDRVSQHPNLAFDISMTDIFAALCNGAALVPVQHAIDRTMPARFIAREKITVWNSVPSVVSLMMQGGGVTADNLASLRLMNFCGEPLLREHLDAIFKARPTLWVQNTYGPTEATISMTCLRLRARTYKKFCENSVALGDPIPGMEIVLAGGTHEDEGEIVLTGPQLADEYWQDDEKTASAFRVVATPDGLRRGYWTGDWAERRDGNIFFKERIDFQVKVLGYRIELDEVAAGIRDCGWPVAVVFKRGDALAAVVERVPGKEFNESALRKALIMKIEPHAVPAGIVEVLAMPRNDNDKLDRKGAAQAFEEALQAKAAFSTASAAAAGG